MKKKKVRVDSEGSTSLDFPRDKMIRRWLEGTFHGISDIGNAEASKTFRMSQSYTSPKLRKNFYITENKLVLSSKSEISKEVRHVIHDDITNQLVDPRTCTEISQWNYNSLHGILYRILELMSHALGVIP